MMLKSGRFKFFKMDRIQIFNFLAQFVVILGDVVRYAIIARIILSWFSMGNPQPGRFAQMLNDATDPVINLAKKIPHKIGMFDLAPLIALIGVDILVYLSIQLLNYMAAL